MVGEVDQPWAKHFRHEDLDILFVIRRNPAEHSFFGINESACAAVFLGENIFAEAIDSLCGENLDDSHRHWSILQNLNPFLIPQLDQYIIENYLFLRSLLLFFILAIRHFHSRYTKSCASNVGI